jgi:hypothetical protein
MQRDLGAIRCAYQGGEPRPSNGEVEDRIASFFGHCNDLPDWLEQSLQGVRRSDIDDLVYRNACLRLGKSAANVDKHHTLRDPNDLKCSIEHTEIDGETGRYRVTLRYEDPRLDDPLDYDALQLAEECEGVWRRFLGDNGAKPD